MGLADVSTLSIHLRLRSNIWEILHDLPHTLTFISYTHRLNEICTPTRRLDNIGTEFRLNPPSKIWNPTCGRGTEQRNNDRRYNSNPSTFLCLSRLIRHLTVYLIYRIWWDGFTGTTICADVHSSGEPDCVFSSWAFSHPLTLLTVLHISNWSVNFVLACSFWHFMHSYRVGQFASGSTYQVGFGMSYIYIYIDLLLDLTQGVSVDQRCMQYDHLAWQALWTVDSWML